MSARPICEWSSCTNPATVRVAPVWNDDVSSVAGEAGSVEALCATHLALRFELGCLAPGRDGSIVSAYLILDTDHEPCTGRLVKRTRVRAAR